MSKLVWDDIGEHFYETGVRNGVLYPMVKDDETGEWEYDNGVAWNGLTAVTENPTGAEANAIYADDIKYLNLYSAEEYGMTIEAYTYPDEFEECDGSKQLVAGAMFGQQERKMFGFCYRTVIGNDTEGESLGYKIHIVYGCKASPSSRNYNTINDSPEAITFSWECTTTPVPVKIGDVEYKPTSTIVVDSTKFVTEAQQAALKALENKLYGTNGTGGTGGTDPALPLPAEVITLLTPAA